MISVEIDAEKVEYMVRHFPKTANEVISETVERIGRKVERESKVLAPAITGNLRRQIRFIQSKKSSGVVKSFANYSKYVHGLPFYKNKTMRKETPFLTDAIASQDLFIKKEIKAMPKKMFDRL